MKLKRETFYVVGGKQYADKKDALRAEAWERLEARLREAPLRDIDEDIEPMRDWMVAEGWGLISTLSEIARRGAPEKQDR